MILKQSITAPVADKESITCLFNNLDLILSHRDEILSNENLRNIYIPGMFVAGLYVGGHKLCLGDMLNLWDKTEWCSGGRFYYSIIGTPLSGMNTAHWYNTENKQFESGTYNNGNLSFLGLALPAFQYMKQQKLNGNRQNSSWSIFDLIKSFSHQR